jgi:HK97 family phage portal protein
MSLKTFAQNVSRLWKEPEGQKDNPVLPTIIPIYQNEQGITYPSDIRLAQNAYQQIAALHICVKTRGEAFASVPLKLYRVKKNGEIEELTSHRILDLLYKVNPFMSYTDFWNIISNYLDLTGNAYFLIDYDRWELWPLRPNRVKIVGHPTEYISHYTYQPDNSGKIIGIPKEMVIHFRLVNPNNDYYGLPPVEACSSELALEHYAVKYNINFFKNDATPKSVFESDQNLTEEDVKRISSWWKALHQGVDNAHKIGIVGKGGKINVIGSTMKDMDYNVLRKYEREMIYAIYKVPPAMGGMFDTPYQLNLKDQVRYIFWGQGINPGLAYREEVLNQIFLPRVNGSNEPLLLKYDLNAIEILNESLAEKADTALKLRQTGWTINELRELTGKEEVEGGEMIPALQPSFFNLGSLGQGEPKHLIPLKFDSAKMRLLLGRHKELQNGGREIRWKRFDELLRREEDFFAVRVANYFAEQGKRVLANYDELNPSKSKKVKQGPGDLNSLFSDADEQKRLEEKVDALLKEVLKSGANQVLSELGVAIDFNLTDPTVRAWLEQKIFKLAGEITATTREKLRQILLEGVDQGLTIAEIRDNIVAIYDDWAIPHKIDAVSRAEMVARTETHSAYMMGKFSGMVQSNVVEGKEWLSARDDRVRDSHLIDGEQRKLYEPFSNGLQFPNDPSGPPEQVINCRCDLLDVLEKLE